MSFGTISSILSFDTKTRRVITLQSLFIDCILSLITSTFALSIVSYVAIICLLRFVKLTVSLSTTVISPTPALANASTANPPTPPTPNTITLLFLNLLSPSFPINSSVLVKECSAIVYPLLNFNKFNFILHNINLL